MARAKSKNKNEGSAKQTKGKSRAIRKPPANEWLPSVDPSSLVRRFIDEVDRLADDFGVGRGLLSSFERELPGAWAPPIEVFKRDGQLTVHADLPGLRKDDVKVELADNAVTIEGERRNERKEQQEGFYRSERSYGRFFRRVPLPEGFNSEEARASFSDGVLEITMPARKGEAKAARKLEIVDGGELKARAKAA
jgi:HSP20 family protein